MNKTPAQPLPSDLAGLAQVVKTGLEAEAILDICVQESSMGTVILGDGTTVCPMRFASVSEDSVVLDLLGDSQETIDAYQPLAMCCVIFNSSIGEASTFLTPIKQVCEGTDSTRSQLVLRPPSFIATAHGRNHFRIPCWNGGLKVQLTDENGMKWSAHPVNISASGLLVKLDASADPHFQSQGRALIKLSLGNRTVECRAMIRRRHKLECAFVFNHALRGKTESSSQDFLTILVELESHWLRTRH